ncbi:MAG: hypothetical protein H0T39_06660 [Actinobacteria bacterium]|nr:hypothetical protein [Actinomycetota bacterium]
MRDAGLLSRRMAATIFPNGCGDQKQERDEEPQQKYPCGDIRAFATNSAQIAIGHAIATATLTCQARRKSTST